MIGVNYMKGGERAVENEKKKMVYISGRISGNKNYKKEKIKWKA